MGHGTAPASLQKAQAVWLANCRPHAQAGRFPLILGSGPVSFTLPVGLTWVESGHPAFSSFSEVAYLSQGPRQEGPPLLEQPQ